MCVGLRSEAKGGTAGERIEAGGSERPRADRDPEQCFRAATILKEGTKGDVVSEMIIPNPCKQLQCSLNISIC